MPSQRFAAGWPPPSSTIGQGRSESPRAGPSSSAGRPPPSSVIGQDRSEAPGPPRPAAAEGRFPFPGMRPGQGEAAEAVRSAMDEGSCLLLSAPTGIGKTAAAAYGAALHQAATGAKLFYVTSRTTQQLIVVETYRRMAAAGWGLRAIQLAAKGRICPEPDGVCPSCPRMDAYRRHGAGPALAALASRAVVVPRDVLAAAESCGRACPFEVSLDASLSCDVVVSDYNYVFHPTAYLQRYFEGPHEGFVLVADEAHDLRDRAMDAFSPKLPRALGEEAVALCRRHLGEPFSSLAEAWSRLGEALDEVDLDPQRWYRPEDAFIVELPAERFHLLFLDVAEAMEGYFALPRKRRLGGERRDALSEAFMQLAHVDRVLAEAGDEFVPLFWRGRAEFQVACLDPSRVLARRVGGFRSAVAMSATLEPVRFFREVLGLPSGTRVLCLPSPFPRANRLVRVVGDVSTRYRDRAATAQRVADIVRTVAAGAPGNACAFFPSFEYLRLVRPLVGEVPGREVVEQGPGMGERERNALIGRMKRERGLLVLAVQGGSLSEGVDLPGEALSACAVVSPALPTIGLLQELVRGHFDRTRGHGFAYAYAYPGMNRVVQSAGRVIRTPEDVGAVVLVCERFATPFYLGMMPSHWYDRAPEELVLGQEALEGALVAFWARHGGAGEGGGGAKAARTGSGDGAGRAPRGRAGSGEDEGVAGLA